MYCYTLSIFLEQDCGTIYIYIPISEYSLKNFPQSFVKRVTTDKLSGINLQTRHMIVWVQKKPLPTPYFFKFITQINHIFYDSDMFGAKDYIGLYSGPMAYFQTTESRIAFKSVLGSMMVIAFSIKSLERTQ